MSTEPSKMPGCWRNAQTEEMKKAQLNDIEQAQPAWRVVKG